MIHRAFAGASVQIVDVDIPELIAYEQFSARHLVHATLAGWTLPSSEARRLDLVGGLSFTPAGQDRRNALGRSRILGAQIALDPAWTEEAAGQSLGKGWRTAFDAADNKAFAAARLAAKAAQACESLACETLLVALARHLALAYGGAERRASDGWLHPAALARVIDRLQASRGRDLSLSDLAQEAGLGISAFSRAFRGATGRTPMAFALDVRLDHAERLLADGDFDIDRISAETGFASASHLVRTFRLRRGETPGRRRRRLLRECQHLGETSADT